MHRKGSSAALPSIAPSETVEICNGIWAFRSARSGRCDPNLLTAARVAEPQRAQIVTTERVNSIAGMKEGLV
jgi:hypothetical protein